MQQKNKVIFIYQWKWHRYDNRTIHTDFDWKCTGNCKKWPWKFSRFSVILPSVPCKYIYYSKHKNKMILNSSKIDERKKLLPSHPSNRWISKANSQHKLVHSDHQYQKQNGQIPISEYSYSICLFEKIVKWGKYINLIRTKTYFQDQIRETSSTACGNFRLKSESFYVLNSKHYTQ